MRLSPVNYQFGKNQAFNGIKVFTHKEEAEDRSQEITVDVDHYDYYPFSDETPDEFPKSNVEFSNHPYPIWNTISGNEYHIKPALSITKAQYQSLRSERVSDQSILNVFS